MGETELKQLGLPEYWDERYKDESTLTSDLVNLGYHDQISVDFSNTVIAQMQSRYPNLDWRVDDVRHLQLEDRSIDIAIDKGTMDAMLYGSPWDPPPEVQDNVAKYVNEIARLLRPKDIADHFAIAFSGKWIYITFRQPHFVKAQVARDSIWNLRVVRLDDGPGTFEYFGYIMAKHDSPNQGLTAGPSERETA
ncbi:MAG: hypothetical protein Q9164_002618 [Protoblastenia rupestris]